MAWTGTRLCVFAWLAATALLPDFSVAAEKKTKVDIANEKAMADWKAINDKNLDTWQDAFQWRAVTPEELAMTGEPRAPGAAAVFLYTETERNNINDAEMNYWQTKILTEEGRNLANIRFTYNRETDEIRRIDARVIQPDGTIVPFTGEIDDRPLLASAQQSISVKSFTLPNVVVGSIIEVRYWRLFKITTSGGRVTMSARGELEFHPGVVNGPPPPRWFLNQQLFTRHARYALQLSNRQFVRWSLPNNLPAGTPKPTVEANNVVRMEVHNMPEFVTEDHMPPADDLVLSVDFGYDRLEDADVSDPRKYWKALGESSWNAIEGFLGNPKYVSKRLQKIISKADSAEQKYRKIYEHVREIGNSDIPGSMNDAMLKKCSAGHEHVWNIPADRCGNTAELQLYFIALCRSAGLPAAPVLVATRRERFYSPEIPDGERLDGWLVAVNIDGREVLLNPGVPFLPFGAMIWWDTAVPGFRLAKDGGAWFTTLVPKPADALTQRRAKLALSEDGSLEGTVVVKHTGHEATARILPLLTADERTRADVLKEDLRQALVAPAEISVIRQPDWRARNGVIETEYRIKVQQWAVTSGDRLLIGVGLFGNEQVGKFVALKREHSIYFEYPFAVEDELEITLPAGYQIQHAPAKQPSPDAELQYVSSVESGAGKLSIRRSIVHNLLLIKQNQYTRVKNFYELIRARDQEQIVLTR